MDPLVFLGSLVTLVAGAAVLSLVRRAGREAKRNAAARADSARDLPPAPPTITPLGALPEPSVREEDGPLRQGLIVEFPIPLARTPAFSLKPLALTLQQAAPDPEVWHKTGDAEFDRAYLIECHHRSFVERWATPEARAAVARIHALVGADGFEISLAGNGLRIRTRRRLPEPEREPLVEACRTVARGVFAALGCPVDEEPGLRFVPVEQIDRAPGTCQVCGEAIESGPVACARCGTPSHADCWRYAGGCSTYGCGGQECRP